ncbi:sigma-54-dependent Fis family transcriptional regulator [bacterium]|nr:sigma-54-dependent Fis family transcriptional regulator [bacterium]
MKYNILVVDDEESMCDFMEIMLKKAGYNAVATTDATTVKRILKDDDFDMVISDIVMPNYDGIRLLKDIKQADPKIEVILITAYASINTAINALREGAADYITKPFRVEEIKHAIKKTLETRELKKENVQLKQKLKKQDAMEAIIGDDPSILRIKDLIKTVAPTDSTVLITGESGTGKELVARGIHQMSNRADGLFVSINCAALPENLLESEIFGHKKGSFTGAISDKDGLFKVAADGTFFLDEVSETTPSIQVKLLRAIEEKVITPVGEVKPIEVNTRLIAATNANLKDMCDDGTFREDLFYRLNVFPIQIPPLRERKGDILLIAEHFLEQHARHTETKKRKLSNKVKTILESCTWRGNVRELENVIERALVLCKEAVITEEHLPGYLLENKEDKTVVSEEEKISPTLENIEKSYIYWVLNQTGGNKAKTAELLGINTSTLYRKIKKYKLEDSDDD